MVLLVIIVVLIISWWGQPQTSGSTTSNTASTSNTRTGGLATEQVEGLTLLQEYPTSPTGRPSLALSASGRLCTAPGGEPGRLFNSFLAPSDFPVKALTDVVPPTAYDIWRQKGWLLPIRDQRQCGSCWAFSAIGVLGQRIVIATQGVHKVPLSAQFLVSCDADASGCDGAQSLHQVFGSLTYNGVGLGVPGGTVAERWYPYEESNSPNASTLLCDREKVKGRQIYDFEDDGVVCLSESDNTGQMSPTQLTNNILRIKQELMSGGPVSACYAVYLDFMAWNGRNPLVYRASKSSGNPLQGYHAVVIVGWGVTGLGAPGTPAGVPYWIMQNSWGTGWAQAGYWYHEMGDNYTFMESNCHAGIPKLDNAAIQAALATLRGGTSPFVAQEALSVLRQAPTGIRVV